MSEGGGLRCKGSERVWADGVWAKGGGEGELNG